MSDKKTFSKLISNATSTKPFYPTSLMNKNKQSASIVSSRKSTEMNENK